MGLAVEFVLALDWPYLERCAASGALEQVVSDGRSYSIEYHCFADHGRAATEPLPNWMALYDVDAWLFSSWKGAFAAAVEYDYLRDHLEEPLRSAFDAFFSLLFWHGEWDENGGGCDGPWAEDLGAEYGYPEGPLLIALSPASVRRLLTCWRDELAGQYESLRAAWEAVDQDRRPISALLPTFEAFADYLGRWLTLLETAAARQAGILGIAC
jgi:hypothetical protein